MQTVSQFGGEEKVDVFKFMVDMFRDPLHIDIEGLSMGPRSTVY